MVWLVLLAAFMGALIGDLCGFLIGWTAGVRLVARYVRGEKGTRRLKRAERELDRRGMALIAAAQFVPGRRNVVMVAAGTLAFPLPRFLLAETIGAGTWASFQTALGYSAGGPSTRPLPRSSSRWASRSPWERASRAVDRLRRRGDDRRAAA